MVVSAPPAIRVYVRGTPQTKGSLMQRHRWMPNGHCILGISEMGAPKLSEWRALVATAAKNAMAHSMPHEGPMGASMTFFFERPKSHTRAESLIRWVFTRGRYDLDKLVRAVLDACTDAAVWLDDGQVSRIVAAKVYCDGFQQPGVILAIEALPATPVGIEMAA